MAWAAAQSTVASDAFPVRSVVPGVLTSSALAGTLFVRNRNGQVPPLQASLLAIAAGVGQLLGTAPYARRFPMRSDGTPRLPAQNAALLPALVGGYLWSELSKRDRLAAGTALGAFAAGGYLTAAKPRDPRYYLLNLATATAGAAFGGHRYRAHAESDLRREVQLFDVVAQRAHRSGAHEGRHEEWTLIRSAALEAAEMIRSDLAPEVSQRCAACLALIVRIAEAELALTASPT